MAIPKIRSGCGPETLLRTVIWVPFIASLVALTATLLSLDSLVLLMFCLFAFMTSMGILGPNAMALAMANQGHRAGSASALMGATQFLIGTLGSMAVSLVTLPGALPLTGVLLFSATASLMVYQFGRVYKGKHHARRTSVENN